MPQVEEQVKRGSSTAVLPWGIQADHPRNSDLLIQCIPNCRLRSAISGVKGVVDKNGDIRVPIDQTRHLGSFPQTPGMELHVNPAELSYVIIDPLRDDEKMLDRVKRYLRDNGHQVSDRLNGLEPQHGKLDIHRMKTLCREMLWLVQAGEAKKVKGALPSLEDIAELPGKFLLNPGSRVHTTQPVYEEDFEAWVDRLSHMGQ